MTLAPNTTSNNFGQNTSASGVIRAASLLALGAACGASMVYLARESPVASSSQTRVNQQDEGSFVAASIPSKNHGSIDVQGVQQQHQVSLSALLAAAKEPSPEQQYRREHAKGLIDLLRTKEAEMAARPHLNEAEQITAEVLPYMMGVADTIVKTSPEIVDELADEIDSTLCDPSARDSRKLLMVRLTMALPDTASSRGYDCVFSRESAEDIVTWTALDALRATDLPKSSAIERLEQVATDERTLRRFNSDFDVERRERTATVASESVREERL